MILRLAAAAAVLLTAGCGGPSTTDWQQPPSTAGPAVSVLPAGLVALARTDDGTELRVHDAVRGSLLRRIDVPSGEGVVFSPSFAYAADIDRTANLLRIHKLQGTAYEPVTSLNADSLGGTDRPIVSLGFVAATGRLGVELGGGRTVLLDPAHPGTTLADYSGVPADWDSLGGPVTVTDVPLRGDPGRRARVRASAREVIAATIPGWSCSGRQVSPFTLVCAGGTKRAELVTLTTDPAAGEASLRPIVTLRGKPFTRVLVAPDGKRLLAQRADGFYTTTTAGGRPKRAFKTLGGADLLTWN